MSEYIYESPDGGDTIYRRESGSTERKLIHVSEKKRHLHQELMHAKLWGNIHRAAQTDPALTEMLAKVESYYSLKYI